MNISNRLRTLEKKTKKDKRTISLIYQYNVDGKLIGTNENEFSKEELEKSNIIRINEKPV